eukprot:TRINITY_DN14980_c0_g1_i4.p2 TRINITY_DN14980_c0_g1~~TRINITY_DN14980_c0_g1_i4.p2  ORF type:complete len:126 (+),score=5.62 TRINITY_DN14980_c0_g1_i4:29-379(+)
MLRGTAAASSCAAHYAKCSARLLKTRQLRQEGGQAPYGRQLLGAVRRDLGGGVRQLPQGPSGSDLVQAWYGCHLQLRCRRTCHGTHVFDMCMCACSTAECVLWVLCLVVAVARWYV